MPLLEQMSVCLRILQGLGDVGRQVWELGRWYVGEVPGPTWRPIKDEHRQTQEQRLAYLKRAIAWLREKALDDKIRWERLPVDPQTFLEHPEYLNKAHVLWPAVLTEMAEINSGRYVECVLTGAIGVAKSTLAIYTQIYQTYILSCMEDPHGVFDLDPSSEIMIVIQSVNKNAAMDVDFKRLRDAVINSPYFTEKFPFDIDRESDLRFPRNIMIKPVVGHDQAAIGQNVIGGILDEVNFMAVVEKSKQSLDGSVYDQAKQNYDAIARRRDTRFMVMGELPGMLCLLSSRKYPGQFTDKKEQEARDQVAQYGSSKIYVYDRRIWELRPDRFCGKRFRVFVGDASRKPRVLGDADDVGVTDQDLVKSVPVEFRQKFDNDIMGALRDILGVSTQAIHPFMMNVDAITACFSKAQSVVSREDCDFQSTRLVAYPQRFENKEQPRFAHLDLAISRDNAGLAIGHVPRFMEVDRGDVKEMLPVIQYDLLLAINPPRGGEILFSEVRRLLYTLRKLGLPIKWVTADNVMMSKDTLQILSSQGFVTGYCTVDDDPLPYDLLKGAIYDGRVLAPPHTLAQTELVQLEVDPKTEKVDHRPNGSKDVADGMAGVCRGLTMQRAVWHAHKVSLRNAPRTAPRPKEPLAQVMQGSYRDRVVAARGQQRLEQRRIEERGTGSVPFVREPGGLLR